MPYSSEPFVVIRGERRTELIRPVGRDSHLDSIGIFNQ